MFRVYKVLRAALSVLDFFDIGVSQRALCGFLSEFSKGPFRLRV